MAIMATLQQPFTALSAPSDWTQFTGGSATFSYTSTGAHVVFPGTTSSSTDGDLTSNSTFDLTGSFARLNVLGVSGASATHTDCILRLKADASNNVQIFYEAGTLFFSKVVATVQTNIASVTYNATNHAWWQIREKGGTTYWETSSDGVTWTTQATNANPITLTSLTALVGGICFGADTSPTDFIFRYFNYPLPGTTTSTSSTSISTTSVSSTSSSISTSSTSISSTSSSISTSSTSSSLSSTSSSTSSTSSSVSSTSVSSTSSSTSISSTSTSISSTSTSSTSTSSTSSSTSISSTSTSFSSTSSSISSTSSSTSSTSFSSTSSSSSTSTTTLPPPYFNYVHDYNPIQVVHLTTSGGGPGTSFTTASISPAPNALILAFVTSSHNSSGTVDPTSLSGNGLTWVKVISQSNILGANNLSAWRAMGTNPTPGAVTINWDASVSGDWSIVQYLGVDTSGTNGSGAIGNTASNVAITSIHSLQFGLNFTAGANLGTGAVRSPGQIYPTNGLNLIAESRVTGMTSGWATPDFPFAQFNWNNSSSNNMTVAIEVKAARLIPSLTNLFNSVNYGNVSVNDGDYFIQTGVKTLVQDYQDIHQNNIDTPTFTWMGRSTVSTVTSPVNFQIYNQSTLAWETLAIVNNIPADTDFTQTITQSTNIANYYDSQNTVRFRVYQQVN